jgi:hypothetical protein
MSFVRLSIVDGFTFAVNVIQAFCENLHQLYYLCVKFVERESDLSTSGHVPHFKYGPVNAGFNYVMGRPLTVAGTCLFNHVGCISVFVCSAHCQ